MKEKRKQKGRGVEGGGRSINVATNSPASCFSRSPSLISPMASVDVKHRVYLLFS